MATVVNPFRTKWCRVPPTPQRLQECLQKYFVSRPTRLNSDRYLRALDAARKDFLITPVKPLHINDSIRLYKHPEKSPGLPYTKEGLHHKYEVDPQRIKQFVHNLKYGKITSCRTPCSMAGRTHTAETPKVRLIWVYPAHMTYAEGMFAEPLIQSYIQKTGPYSIWMQYHKGDMKFIQSHKTRERDWFGADYSAYDASLPAWLIRDAFNILKERIDFSAYQFWGKPTTEGTLQRLWAKIVNYFINTPIKLSNGFVVKKKHGVPSGSYFTNLIDTVCNSIMMHYLMLKEPDSYWFMGDDLLCLVDKEFDMEKYSEEASRSFGVKLNTEKSEKGEFVSYLGFKMSEHRIPQANYDKLVAQLCLPAKPDRCLGDAVIRARALQLACLGVGCQRFSDEVETWISTLGVITFNRPRKRDDLWRKMEAMHLDTWPSLNKVYRLVV